MSSPTCRIQWIDCGGLPTPDNDPAIGEVVLQADGRRFPICEEHAQMLPRARAHGRSPNCNHVSRFPDTWDFEPYAKKEAAS